MKRAVVVVFALFGLLVNCALAQKPAVVLSTEPGWHKIGEITASFKMESESISVLGADEFASIKLRVTDAPINIDRVQVFYEDGDMEDVDVRNELAPGSETRVIDLKKPNKDLNKITFTYRTLPNYDGDKADIELYGYKVKRDGENNAYRDEDRESRRDDEDNAYRDDENRVEREAEETGREIENETEEAGREIDEEADEAGDEINEEARDVENDAERAGEKVEEGADNLGDKISEAAKNAEAEINDQRYADKVGPDGENIYIDKHSKYYYINNEGNKVYITKAEMKDKVKKD